MDTSVHLCPNETPVSIGRGRILPAPTQPRICPGCNNLLQNPSFESDFTGWVTDNVDATDGSPFEGTQAARMGPGVASMFQDVSLGCSGLVPLFLSFYAEGSSRNSGNLIAEVLWLDKDRNTIGSGLRLLIQPNTRFPIVNTFFDITGRPPAGTAWARLLLSKGLGTPPDDLIKIDQVTLTPVNSINLVQNSGFELGLTGWTATGFEPHFSEPFTGLADADGDVSGGALFQDVPLTNLPANSSFLFSFAVRSLPTSRGALSAQVLWLDRTGAQIGPPGLEFLIPNGPLDQKNDFITYLALTRMAPSGAVTARILFTAREPVIFIDHVILAIAQTTNLVQNPGFEDELDNWESVNFTAVTSAAAYEGTMAARGAATGGVLYQDVPIADAEGHCYLFNCALSNRSANMLLKVVWLDYDNREIGPGLSLVVPEFAEQERAIWLVHTGITEPAPPGTVKARVQFTKSAGGAGTSLDIDKVILGRLI